jgi:DNA-binding transcriptional MerR regulator
MTSDPDNDYLELYLNADEAARALRVHSRTLWAWRKRGISPPWLRIGGTVYFRKESLAAWIAAQEQPSNTGRAA